MTFLVHGREMTFSKEELTAILEKHFPIEKTETAQKPIEGEWFRVNPKTINRKLFESKREDHWQEKSRQIILGAFVEVDANPEKYARSFKTLNPKKEWSEKTIRELKAIADNKGDHLANWIEKALKWAQRISNGETWEAVCNEPYADGLYHLIIWKDGTYRLFGGASEKCKNNFAEDVNYWYYLSGDKFNNAVPEIVLYS